jgi:hypothetical protein
MAGALSFLPPLTEGFIRRFHRILARLLRQNDSITPQEYFGDFKINTYDLPYVYSKGIGVKNAKACSAF